MSGVVHDMVEAANDEAILGDGVILELDLGGCIMGDWDWDQCCQPEGLEQDRVRVVKAGLVLQIGRTFSTNHLKFKKNNQKLF